MKEIILVVAAHPDDEILGCGGTIAKHVQEGDTVHVLILAEGITSREELSAFNHYQKDLSELAEAAHKANNIIGTHSLYLHDFPDNRMDDVSLLKVIKVIESFIEKYHPSIVYTHHIGDVNIDHQITHRAVVTATRPIPNHTVKTVLFFESVSSTEWQTPGSASSFHPNWFVDISGTLDIKLKSLTAYKTEMRDFPHPRSLPALEYLAKSRGTIIGVEAAEAFILGRTSW